jgi:hypothetical protein
MIMWKQGQFGKGGTMKRALIAAMLLSLVLVVPGFAAESNEPPKVPAAALEQRKAQILKQIEERSSKLQKEKNCVQAAKSDDDLNACKGKLGPSHGSVGPGGMGRPGRLTPPGGPAPPGGPTPPGGKTPE